MALSHSPSIVTNGLVLCLDAANRKGYDKFENLMTNSQLGNTVLNDGGMTVTTDTTIANPFGGSDGVLKCVHTTQIPGYFRRGQNMSLTAGVTYTFSFYFKNGTVSNPYGQNPVNNLGILASTYSPTFEEPSQSLNTNIDVGNGWYRQVFTFTPTYTQTYQVDFSQTVNQTPIGTYYLYGFQLERGSSVTDYYATTSTAKNRGTIWSDLSGRGNTGTLQNSTTYNADNLGSFSLDGVDDRILISCNNSTIRTFNSTTQFIIKLPVYSGGQRCILSYRTGGGGALYIGKASNGIFCFYNELSTSSFTVGNIASNATVICTVTCDATNNLLSTYINGTLAGSASRTGWISTYHTSLYLGWDAGGTNEYMLGNFYQFSHYNRVLTAAEVQQNFNALRGRFGI